MTALDDTWKEVRVGATGVIFTGRTPPSQHIDYFGDAYPFITPGDMHQGKYARKTDRNLSDEGAALLRRIKLPPNSVCVSCIGWQMGEVILTDRESFTNQQINSIVPAEGYDPSYLYYAFRLRKQELLSLGSAAGVRTPILNKSAFANLTLRIPSFKTQRRIASILTAYDDLIEANQRRIHILEEIARTIYRKDLQSCTDGFATGAVLKCTYWRFVSENVGKYSGKKRYYATADVDGLEVTGPGIEYAFADKPSRAQKQPIPHSVWFARMKDTYKIAWYGTANTRQASDSVLSSGFAGFEACHPDLWPLLFLTISSREFHVQKDMYCTGATQMALTNDGLSRIEMPIPGEPSARRLGVAVGPMLELMLVLQKKNEVLCRTRDLLLPRLISGELSVATAERELEAVA